MTKSIWLIGALASALLSAAPARASCIQFEETKMGNAYLVNICPLEINAAYGLTGGGDWTPGDSPLVRVHVAADERKLLWSDDSRPLRGRYKIKVFSCVAPSTLIYPAGGRPTCQVSYADAG